MTTGNIAIFNWTVMKVTLVIEDMIIQLKMSFFIIKLTSKVCLIGFIFYQKITFKME